MKPLHEDINASSQELESILDACERYLDERLYGKTRDLNREIGRAHGLLTFIQDHTTQAEADKTSTYEDIKGWENRISSLKRQALTLALLDSPIPKKQRDIASNMGQLHEARVSQNLRNMIRYVLLAAATAMVGSLAAMSQAWEKDAFVAILAWAILYRFVPALFCAGLAEVAFNMTDAKSMTFWQSLAEISTSQDHIDPTPPKPAPKYIHVIGSISLGLATGTLISGIMDTSRAVLEAKSVHVEIKAILSPPKLPSQPPTKTP
jgi:hypothetical protein